MPRDIQVSIIIPYHNCIEMTRDCLKSVVEHSRDVRYEMILIDDASTIEHDFSDILQGIPTISIRNEARRSYSENNNAGARVSSGTFLCLLNNDTYVTPGWLSAMVLTLDQEKNVGVLGNKHLFPKTGLLQHAGIAITDEGDPLHLHPGADPNSPAVNYLREVPAVTFACVMVPRTVYDALDGLDEIYRNGYEDVDFCFRASRAGYRIVYTPASVIYHYGQSTPGRTDIDNVNRERYRRIWLEAAPRNYNPIMHADFAFNDRRGAPRAQHDAIHFWLDCSKPSAFTWAGVELVMALHAQGRTVTLPRCGALHDSINPEYAPVLTSMFTDAPRAACHVKWTHYWPEHFRAPLFGEVNAELFCTNYRYPDPSRPLDLWTRHVLLNEYRKIPISGFNDAILETLGVPAADRRIVPLGYSPEIDRLDPDQARLPRPRSGDLHLLLMTNSHDLYRYGTDLAIEALARAYTEADPIVVHIKDYGSQTSDTIKAWIARHPRFPRVCWHNEFLPKDELIRLYAAMDVQLSPFRGEGFAMKIIDAMAVGVPCVMPLYGGPTEYCDATLCLPVAFTEGPVGTCYDSENYYLGQGAVWCEPDLDALTAVLARLTGDRDGLRQLGERARAHVRAHFSWQHSANRLLTALSGWRAQRAVTVSRRLGPDRYPLSVVIPTKDRPDQLRRSFDAYVHQTLPAADYQIILVNDHGDRAAVEAVARAYPGLTIDILDNDGPGGPGAARNYGIERAAGEVVLITGDDIVPNPDFLQLHRDAHTARPEDTTAFVGTSPWHPDLGHSPFLDYLTGDGGEQFDYNGMVDGEPVSFDRFYTSNVSIKRRFLCEQERIFSDKYRFAAYEDVELGYRLHLQGLTLRYLRQAIGLHYHPVDAQSFLNRQYKVGRMLTVLALQRPSYMPYFHFSYLRQLEMLRCTPEVRQRAAQLPADDQDMAGMLLGHFQSLLELNAPAAFCQDSQRTQNDMHVWKDWMRQKYLKFWTTANELTLRKGIVDEWAGADAGLADLGWRWIRATLSQRLFTAAAPEWDVPFGI